MIVGTLFFMLTGVSLTIEPMAFTYHAALISQAELTTIQKMGKPLTDDGRMTFHSGSGMTLRWDHIQFTGIYFRNSFDQHSGSMMVGPTVHLSKYFTLGFMAGMYVRKFIDGMSIPFSYKNKVFELAPMAMVTGSFAIKLYKNVSLEVNAGSNYVLNFFTPGIRYDF